MEAEEKEAAFWGIFGRTLKEMSAANPFTALHLMYQHDMKYDPVSLLELFVDKITVEQFTELKLRLSAHSKPS